jgi:hypothetical protein
MNRDQELIPLRQAIRELSEEQSLGSQELESLQSLTESKSSVEIPSRRRWLAVAASLGAVSVAGVFGVSLIGGGSNAYAMADEIASNHLRPAPLDIESSDLDELRRAFSSLGFSLLDAAEVENVPGTLLGGRFCSISSAPAARLIYLSDQGPISVYQTIYDEQHHRGAADMDRGEPGNVIHARGVEVCLCHTRGILFATATGASPA